MLSTLLSGLGTYFSKYFIVSSFLPLVAFGFVNAFVTYLVHQPFHAWVNREVFEQASATRTTFLTMSVAIGLLIAAYVLSGLGTFLRGILEGKWPDGLRRLFIRLEEHRLRGFERRRDEAAQAQVDLASAEPQWVEDLRSAREAGKKNHGGQNTFQRAEDVDERLSPLRALRNQDRVIPKETLDKAVKKLVETLGLNDAEAEVTPGRRSLLDAYHGELILLIRFSVERAIAEHFRHHNERHSNFGVANLAPTRMGNIANIVQSYAVRRYNCNFEMIWSQLQRSVQKEDKAYAALQESKAQLDFLVACCWLSILSVTTWVVVLSVWSPSVAWFVLVALAGPLFAYFWYRAAAEHYRAFGDLLMTLLDVFRFDVLKDLRIPAPADVAEERIIWDSLHRLSRYGEDLNFRFQHPKAP